MKKLTALVCSLIVSSYACATMQLDMQVRSNDQDFSASSVVENGVASCLFGALRIDATVQKADNGALTIAAHLYQITENNEATLIGEVAAFEAQAEQISAVRLNDENGNVVMLLGFTPHVVAE